MEKLKITQFAATGDLFNWGSVQPGGKKCLKKYLAFFVVDSSPGEKAKKIKNAPLPWK